MAWLSIAVLALAAPSSSDVVLLDFYADWCGPCRQMTSTIDELSGRGYPVRRVNVDRERALAERFKANQLPCFVMVVDGREVDRVVGLTSYGRLAGMFHKASLAAAPPPAAPPPAAPPPAAPPTDMPRRMPSAGLPAVASGPVFVTAPPDAAAPSASIDAVPVAATNNADVADADGWTGRPRSAQEPVLGAQLIAASVRLRIEDPDGHSCGSGTIIDTRRGWALILTCGHIFRDSKGRGRIEVDLFDSGQAQRVIGELVSYDLGRDVGLVRIRAPKPVAVARVAPPGYDARVDDPVISVGCDNGADPTILHTRVRSKDRFLGPPNLQTDGLPVEGRSGGGLFAADGRVVGVCNMADPKENQGLFAALPSIHAELDRAGLGYVYEQPAESPPAAALAAVSPPAIPETMPRFDESAAPVDGPMRPTSVRSTEEPATAWGDLSLEERAALQEIARRKTRDAEVICIIRSRSKPSAPSEVLVLDGASPGFLRGLESLAQGDPLPPVAAAPQADR
ncbi:MAG: trypsin-like peptidase domain-containing protein [Pirellulales bacterium]|nr:trypsin-like peptidase domain-containing protein [Pirellulales bacterium]